MRKPEKQTDEIKTKCYWNWIKMSIGIFLCRSVIGCFVRRDRMAIAKKMYFNFALKKCKLMMPVIDCVMFRAVLFWMLDWVVFSSILFRVFVRPIFSTNCYTYFLYTDQLEMKFEPLPKKRRLSLFYWMRHVCEQFFVCTH